MRLIILILFSYCAYGQCRHTPFADVYVPNAFTPNGDGVNDLLYPLGDDECCGFTLLIFNRWGEKVFETESINNGWDGTHHGKPLNPGVFVFYVVSKCNDNIYEGSITLIK